MLLAQPFSLIPASRGRPRLVQTVDISSLTLRHYMVGTLSPHSPALSFILALKAKQLRRQTLLSGITSLSRRRGRYQAHYSPLQAKVTRAGSCLPRDQAICVVQPKDHDTGEFQRVLPYLGVD